MRRKLFVYAELMQEGRPTVSAPGELRLRPNGDGAARFAARSKSKVYGQILPPSDDTRELAAKERPQYARRTIVLTDGTLADAFEYIGEGWPQLEKVESGRWPGKRQKET